MSELKYFIRLFFIICFVQTIRARLNFIPGNKVCMTETCVKEAESLLKTINENVSPCDDFYEFVCGKWIQNKQLPEYKSKVTLKGDLKDELKKQIKDLIQKTDLKNESRDFIKNIKYYYNSCINTTRLEELGDKPLRKLLDQVNGWPLALQQNWTEIKWSDIYLKLRNLGFDQDAFFKISISPDLKDNSRRILSLDHPTFITVSRESILKGENHPMVRSYKNMMKRSALKLGAKEDTIGSDVEEILNLEKLMAKKSMANKLRTNKEDIYNKITIRELIDLAPNIDWLNILQNYTLNRIRENEQIVVNDLPYIKALNEFLPAQNNRLLANFVIWSAIMPTITSLNEEWLQIKQQLISETIGTKARPPRWEICISDTQNRFGIALSHLYVKKYFSEENKEKASKMFTNVINEFRKSLESNTWMGTETRREALRKLDNMKYVFGYPQELMDESKLTQYYQSLRIDSTDYFGNGGRLNKWFTDLSYSDLREPVYQYDWRQFGDVAVVNAYYYLDYNVIVMSAGMLQGIYFNKDRPDYLNYGSIAYVLCHEIIHGFDEDGRQQDSKRNLRNWWDNKTYESYKAKTKCIISLYSNYTIKEVGKRLNGINTQGENIADNGGILQAFRAYLKSVEENGFELLLPSLNYSHKQLFWISSARHSCSKSTVQRLKFEMMASSHSPSKPRVNLLVSNSRVFSEAFGCPLGSPMNPINKCKIW